MISFELQMFHIGIWMAKNFYASKIIYKLKLFKMEVEFSKNIFKKQTQIHTLESFA